MLFNTWLYAFFLAAVFALYWAAPGRARPYVLIAAGLAFYANYHPPHLLLVAALTVFTYAAGELMIRRTGKERTLALVAGLVVTLGALAYYKYRLFVLEAFVALSGRTGAEPPTAATLAAPLAISFFTFEFVHYLVEVRRGTVRASPRDFALFIFFFPTLVAGPIKRFQNFAKSLDFAKRLDWVETGAGLERILFGLSKKIIVADTVATLSAPVWAQPLAYGPGALWLASYGYAVQIYMDFSGYSDVAIGSARLLGFKVEENFDWPYLRSNIRDFWRSWHMSLTSWITDYLYIPLGGNRLGRSRAILNTMIAMGLCGLWHGAAFHFVLWGLYHGAALSVYRLYRDFRRQAAPAAPTLAGRVTATLFTFHVVVVGWVFFVVDSRTALQVIARMLLPWEGAS